MKTIPIAFAFDNNLLFPAKICISSLLMSANEDTFYDIFILHGDDISIDQTDLLRLQTVRRNCRIQFRGVPAELFKDCYEVRGITVATYYRLFIPEVVQEYDKILYSDVDVIFREDQSKYFDVVMDDSCYVAGVNSVGFVDRPKDKVSPEERCYDSPGYIYAGNIVLNAKVIREKNVTHQFLAEMKKQHLFQDMEVLNVVCKGHLKRLPPSFCLTPRLERIIMTRREELGAVFSPQEMEEAFIHGTVHYAGPKPWKTSLCIDADVWWNAYRESIFHDPLFTYRFGEEQFNLFDRLPLKKRLSIIWRFFKSKVL